MNSSAVPDGHSEAPPAERAEVVLIITSLGSIRRQCWRSRKAQHLLDCKQADYTLIDVNRDGTQSDASWPYKDSAYVRQWRREGLLMEDTHSIAPSDSPPQDDSPATAAAASAANGAADAITIPTTSAEQILIPQVLLDGVSIGDDRVLQDLEDDGYLDKILDRLMCPSPSCRADRFPDEPSCPSCRTPFRQLISHDDIDRCRVQQVLGWSDKTHGSSLAMLLEAALGESPRNSPTARRSGAGGGEGG
ncbi:unnamed protein product [Vitrella brassicaformis CCMP3155]|uniref:Uncharacterized protein n=2 Tax=Vitrella brassicaformis TaxID=1169539 RepID=A0A0G4G1J4_VITBC|nr:unnamed protein product [Vitrella brassicaformis CCMP3155]|eukprot:CEM21746.1 unnamed protein product [Vitrella brassicaformis CCMP3155]